MTSENYRDLLNKINQKKKELFELQQEYNDKLVLMYLKTKGKHTFVFQPLKQVHNLKSSGWIIVDDFDAKVQQLGITDTVSTCCDNRTQEEKDIKIMWDEGETFR